MFIYIFLFGKKLWRLWRPLSKKLRSKSKQPHDCRFTPPLILSQLSGEKSMKRMPGSTGMWFTSGIEKFFKDRHYLDKEWGKYFSGAGRKVFLEELAVKLETLFSHWLRCMQMFSSMHAIFQKGC
ncbi:uncharacterized protein LOC126601082 [Malus sylvestris]|uniref:uncharacterized protein LOC126601082 n=1 Tax=Malus sylvestris TaxID=3752 RepID=UPI000499178B|nr:uncharacterized protein LOC103431277 [Malus domestica]XP_050123706.1 uncharacterized protein LOC126601082 [Malus sylvestris]XP_050123708.1 uncharacterized protein LOC126601082 [Malus sylvestris]